MTAETPTARGRRLVDVLIWMTAANCPLESGTNRFNVRVSEIGEAWVERLRW